MKEYTVVVDNGDYGVDYHYLTAYEGESFVDAVTRYNTDIKRPEYIRPINISEVVIVFYGKCEEVSDRWWM